MKIDHDICVPYIKTKDTTFINKCIYDCISEAETHENVHLHFNRKITSINIQDVKIVFQKRVQSNLLFEVSI